jgi:hypothetical protein
VTRQYKKRARKTDPYMHCTRHGRVPWQHVMCNACSRLYDLKKDEIRMDGICDCGKPLLPSADAENFTARAVCIRCALMLEQIRRKAEKKKETPQA